MKALSFQQPWAWLLVKGYKDIENRSWPLPAMRKGQRIYVYASKSLDSKSMAFIHRRLSPPEASEMLFWLDDWRRWTGAIVGEIDLVDCVSKSGSKWFCGPFGFTIANPVAYKEPIPHRGSLGFFSVKLP